MWAASVVSALGAVVIRFAVVAYSGAAALVSSSFTFISGARMVFRCML